MSKIDAMMRKPKIHMKDWTGIPLSQYERDGWIAELAETPPEQQGECKFIMSGNSMVLAVHGSEGIEFYDVIVKRKGGLW